MVLKGPRFRVSPIRDLCCGGVTCRGCFARCWSRACSWSLLLLPWLGHGKRHFSQHPTWVPVFVALDYLHQCPLICAKFLLQLPVGDDVFLLPLSF